MPRRRSLIAGLVAIAILAPLALHVGLAVFLHRQIDALGDEGDTIWVDHGGATVGPFAAWVRVRDPRVHIGAHDEPIVQANRVELVRHSTLWAWLTSGSFHLELSVPELDQDQAWLRAQGAETEQLALIEQLGLGDGSAALSVQVRYTADRDRLTADLAYDNASRSEPTARLAWVLEDVQRQDLYGLAELRMPRVTVQRLTTEYANDALRRRIADLSQAVSLSEATLLRVLPAPLPYQRLADWLARSDGRAQRVHIEPLLSGVVIQGLRHTLPATPGELTIERLELDRVALASPADRLIVRHLRLGMAGAHLPLQALRAPIRQLLRDVGYREPEFDGYLEYEQQPDSGDATLAPIHLRSEAMGTLNAQLRLQGVDPAALRQQPRASLIGASFERAQLSYKEAGLADRLVAALAQRRGASADQFRAWVGRRAQDVLGARREAVMPAVEDFLREPQRLKITAAPAEPVPMRLLLGPAAMGRYGALAERLAVTAQSGD